MMEYYNIAIIALLAAISPGPDFVVVAKNALTHDRRTAYLSSLGIGFGILIHSTYCVLGLAIIISQSLLLFSVIKYLGAAYLIYLGIKSLVSRDVPIANMIESSTNKQSNWLAFRDGLLTNVLNPKCTLFMLSVFTILIKPDTAINRQAIYGVEIAAVTTVWFLMLSYGLTVVFIKNKIEKIQHRISKGIGAILIMLGIAVVFESR